MKTAGAAHFCRSAHAFGVVMYHAGRQYDPSPKPEIEVRFNADGRINNVSKPEHRRSSIRAMFTRCAIIFDSNSEWGQVFNCCQCSFCNRNGAAMSTSARPAKRYVKGFEGDGDALRCQRRPLIIMVIASFYTLIDKVARHRYRSPTREIAGATASGPSGVTRSSRLKCAAIGQAA